MRVVKKLLCLIGVHKYYIIRSTCWDTTWKCINCDKVSMFFRQVPGGW